MSATVQPFRYALTTNSTSTGFTAQNATTTKPSAAGSFDLTNIANGVGGGTEVPEYLQLMPFGTNGDNDTFDMRLYGWTPTIVTGSLSVIWVPQLLIDVSVVLCALTFTDHAASTFLADTLTVNDGAGAETGMWQSVISPAEDLPASAIVNTRGCQLISFDWDLAGGQEAVSMNCLFRGVNWGHR